MLTKRRKALHIRNPFVRNATSDSSDPPLLSQCHPSACRWRSQEQTGHQKAFSSFPLHHTGQPPTGILVLVELVWHRFCSNPKACLNLFHQHFLSCMIGVVINVERPHWEGPAHTLIHVLSVPIYRKHVRARLAYISVVRYFLRKIMRLFTQRLGRWV